MSQKKPSSTDQLKEAVKKGGRKSPAHAFFDADEKLNNKTKPGESPLTPVEDKPDEDEINESETYITEKNDEDKPQENPEVPDNPEAPEKTIRDVTKNFMSKYDEKSKKKTVEETHARATFLFRKDLQERLDKLAEGKRGFKTMFLNQAVEALLDELEEVHNDR
ncbi:hypothetical protein [Evansella clarkii]|uniref:hypothetical protein n=1 Tax=Evansella clarkii TaxID=79879 RepID=UPI000996102B|nr:hypothetical protein [Evansella clarkii]